MLLSFIIVISFFFLVSYDYGFIDHGLEERRKN